MNYKSILGLFAMVFLVNMIGMGSASTPGPLGSCQNIDTPGYYYFNNSIRTLYFDKPCFFITANNVVIDGRGNTLQGFYEDFFENGQQGIQTYVYGVSNLTIYNLIVDDFDTGLAIQSSNSTNITNNIFTNGNNALMMAGGYNNYIINNNISFAGNRGIGFSSSKSLVKDNIVDFNKFGFYIDGGSQNRFINNTANFNSLLGIHILPSHGNLFANNTANNNQYGINLILSSSNNTLISNTANNNLIDGIRLLPTTRNNTLISNTANNNSYGLLLWGAVGNNIVNNTFKYNFYSGVLFISSANNNILISNTLLSNSPFTILMNISGGINNTILDSSYDLSTESVLSNSQLIRRWYLDVEVKEQSNNPINGATVNAYNKSGSLQFSATTDSNGSIIRQSVIEYINNGGTRQDYSIYNITASKVGYHFTNTLVNMSENKNLVMYLDESIPLTSCGTLNQANKIYRLMNNIQTTGTACFTISADNITLDGQGYNITRSGTTSIGIYSLLTYNNIRIKNVNLFGDGSFTYAISLSVANSSFDNITISAPASNGRLLVQYGWNNRLSNISSNSYLQLYNSSNNYVVDSSFNDIIIGVNSPNSSLVNVSYPLSSESVLSNSQLIRKWYLEVQVKDSNNNPINGATVNAYNKSGALQFSATTDSNGSIIRQSVIEYVNNGGVRQYYSMYNITASKSGYKSNLVLLNITGNNAITIKMKSENNQQSPVLDCNVQWSGYTWQGFNNQVGMKNVQSNYIDNRFICYGNKFYECGWELSDSSLAIKSGNNQVVGNWKCDLNNKKWVSSGQQLSQWVISKFAYPSSNTEVSPDSSGYLVVEIPRSSSLNNNLITQFTVSVASSNMNKKTQTFALYLGDKNVYSKAGNLIIVNLDLTKNVNEYLAKNGGASCTASKCYIVFREKYSGGKPLNGNLVVKGYY